ncbi:unnamed protein product, partial [Rotaria sp. Silwood1]
DPPTPVYSIDIQSLGFDYQEHEYFELASIPGQHAIALKDPKYLCHAYDDVAVQTPIYLVGMFNGQAVYRVSYNLGHKLADTCVDNAMIVEPSPFAHIFIPWCGFDQLDVLFSEEILNGLYGRNGRGALNNPNGRNDHNGRNDSNDRNAGSDRNGRNGRNGPNGLNGQKCRNDRNVRNGLFISLA